MGRLALAVITLAGAAAARAELPAPGAIGGGPYDWSRYCVMTPAGPDEPDPALFRQLKRLIWTEHHVTRSDGSASVLAKQYGTTTMSLQATNNDELLVLAPGRRLVVHNGNGRLYEVKKDTEALSQIVGRYHRDPRQALKFREAIVYANKLPGSAIFGDYEFVRGQRILLPNVTVNFDSYRFPFQGFGWGRISSRFGMRYHPLLHRARFHDGLDIAKPWGTPVYPARSGRVIDAGWTEGYGMLIVIRHSDGATTRYGHLSKIYTRVGQLVQRGKTLIGRVGSTGLSTGAHLHFEVRDRNGKPVNPVTKIGRR